MREREASNGWIRLIGKRGPGEPLKGSCMFRVEIRDLQSDGSLVDLKDILPVLPRKATYLLWSILDLEAVGALGPGRNILDLEETIRKSPFGLQISWHELGTLSKSVFQIMNTTIVGVTSADKFPRFIRSEIESLSEVVIEMIDSTVWIISAADQDFVRSIQQNFSELNMFTE